jgi:anthranilate phosphoribosyltransferase
MNAAAVLLVGEKVGTLQEGISLAKEVIDSGHALTKLEQLMEFSQSLV